MDQRFAFAMDEADSPISWTHPIYNWGREWQRCTKYIKIPSTQLSSQKFFLRLFKNPFLDDFAALAHKKQSCHTAQISQDLSKKATVVTYSAAISACEKGSQWQRALLLLGEMDKKEVGAGQSEMVIEIAY